MKKLVDELFEKIRMAGKKMDDLYTQSYKKHPILTEAASLAALGTLGYAIGGVIQPPGTYTYGEPGRWIDIYKTVDTGRTNTVWRWNGVWYQPVTQKVYEQVVIDRKWVEGTLRTIYENPTLSQMIMAVGGVSAGIMGSVAKEVDKVAKGIKEEDDEDLETIGNDE